MDDKKGEVSKILDAIGLEQLHHKDMVKPLRVILADLLTTGKVGRNQLQLGDVEKTIRQLTTTDIDAVIDRYAWQGKKAQISCPEDYLKTCLLTAGRSVKLAKTAGSPSGEGAHCGNPSYDIDKFVRLSMEQIHGD
jgi:hypothetical protein